MGEVNALLYQWWLSGNEAILWSYGVKDWGLGFAESFMSSKCSILVILIVTRQVLLSPGSSQPYLCICIFDHSGDFMSIWDKILGFGLARIVYMFNMFNLNIAACHQTGTCHWEHSALLLIGNSLVEISWFCARISHRIGFCIC